jgi:hypothetical protein
MQNIYIRDGKDEAQGEFACDCKVQVGQRSVKEQVGQRFA